jgi:anaerobic selenocysteine-containing dehydrogenase
VQIVYQGKQPLDRDTAPSQEELLAIRCRDARVTLDELRRYPSGKAFDHPDNTVAEGLSEARFDVMPADVAAELTSFLASCSLAEGPNAGLSFRYLLSSRRSPYIFNSTLVDSPEVRKRFPGNPVYIHPDDMAEQGMAAGDDVRIESEHGSIATTGQPDADMRRGVVSLVHGWGGPAEAGLYSAAGAAYVCVSACEMGTMFARAGSR